MRNERTFRRVLGIACALSLIAIFFAVCLGSTSYDPGTVLRVIGGQIPGLSARIGEIGKLEYNMIWKLRIPRVLLGFVVGAALSVCGVAMQALMRNQLADPFVLGVSSGASAAASLFMVFGAFAFLGRYALPLSAFLGALAALVFVYRMALVNGRLSRSRMLLSGVAAAMVMDAVTSYVAVAAPNAFAVYNVSFWLSGSLAGAKWAYLTLPTLVMLACTLCLMGQHRALDALTFGEDAAQTLGVPVASTQKTLVLIASLLAGAAISVSGSIGFVGMIVPHLCRGLVGASHKRLLLLAPLIGGVLVVWADVAARVIAAPEEIPVGILTALLGAPCFLIILKSGRANRG